MEENMIIGMEETNIEVVETGTDNGALTKVVIGLAVIGVLSAGGWIYKKGVKPLIAKAKSKKVKDNNVDDTETENDSDEE